MEAVEHDDDLSSSAYERITTGARQNRQEVGIECGPRYAQRELCIAEWA
jgi:hypothetical protein